MAALLGGGLRSLLRATQTSACSLRGASFFSTFKYEDLKVELSENPKQRPPPEELGFGKVFTDHMLVAEHNDETGWSPPGIVPFQSLQLHPAAQVLHYGICCFEGMKAYTGVDGKGRLFRPDMNMERLRRSASRLMLAQYDPQELLKCIEALLKVDRAWLPTHQGFSMYVRPFAYAAAETLGIHRPTSTTVCAILSPVGPYFSNGAVQGVSLYLDERHVRAWPGGAGDTKIGGNYATTILPQVEASKHHGCSQVIYTLPNGPDPLDATVSECGAMNVFFLLQKPGGGQELVTPPLDGTILPGVTRDSVLHLCRGWGEFEVSERPLTVGELLAVHREGRLLEAFGSGTASVVQPISELVREGGVRMAVGGRQGEGGAGVGAVVQRVKRELEDIQYGRVPHEWSVVFE